MKDSIKHHDSPQDHQHLSHDMIYKFNADGHFTFVNPALCQYLNKKDNELLGTHFSEVIREDYRSEVYSFYLKQYMSKQSSTYLEFPVDVPYKKDSWVGQTVEAILQEGEVVEFLAVSTDITERVLATKTLRRTEERYRHIIDNINLGALEVTNDDVIVNANNSFCDFTGFSNEELVGMQAKSLIARDSVSNFHELNTIGDIARDLPAVELQLMTRDYRLKWAMISGVAVKNKYDEEIGFFCVFYDTTERKQQEIIRQKAERALKESENRVRSILDSSLDGMITIDESGSVTEWNSRAKEIFGYSSEEAIGRTLNELIIPEKYRHAHSAGLSHFLSSGEGPILNRRIEIHAQHKDGSYFPVELSVVPIKLNQHYIFSAFVRDITLKKKAEDDMETALQRQKELAELKSRLISMTSHESRTPLTTIKSSLDLLSFILDNQKLSDKEKIDKNINRINREIDRLDSLVNDILMVGRLESGNLPFTPSEVDAVELCKSVIQNDFGQQADGRKVKMKVSGTPRHMHLDETLYGHILSNLLSNAFKYSPNKDNPSLTLTFDQKGLKIKVKDFGIGIPFSEQSMLFDSFYRASNVKNIQGHGMGLAIVKQFLELHNGRIKVESQPGEGTEFIIFQPYTFET